MEKILSISVQSQVPGLNDDANKRINDLITDAYKQHLLDVEDTDQVRNNFQNSLSDIIDRCHSGEFGIGGYKAKAELDWDGSSYMAKLTIKF